MPTVINNHDGILQQLESSEQVAAQLIAGVSRRQMNWQPNGGASWSIWQCLDHLTRTNRVYCRSMLEAVAHAKKRGKGTDAITPGWFGRWFIASQEPPVKTRHRTMKKVTPGTEGDGQGALGDFADSHSEARRVMASWEQLDFNRVRFRNPFVPLLRFTVGTGLMIINAHDRRHLWQAQRVKEFEGYPAA
jgi:DinB superfamily